MSRPCKDIQEEIGQSVAGDLSVEVHKHLKDCSECDDYAQKIIRLERIFKEEGLVSELVGQSSTRKLKWLVMSAGACIILLLPDTYKLDSGLYLQEQSRQSKFVTTQSNNSADIREDQLDQYVSTWLQSEQDLWEQIGEMDWALDEYYESMEIISQWQVEHLEMQES
tara:strand:+ start:54 stop:554 length:501 start_codon:yes stop_codon:yes gene_type:complete